ncbi:MAG: ABC transporter permease [Planctomycetota bacterium]
MKKIAFLLILLVVLGAIVALQNPLFLSTINIQNTARWIALRSIFAIGVGIVIVTGGIDLSIGSIIGLSGVILTMLVRELGVPAALALLLVLALTSLLGLGQGWLITRLRLQPFIVTLCGLLLFRGIARFITEDKTKGFGTANEAFRYLAVGKPLGIPMPVLILAVVGSLAALFLHTTIWGRHLFALGHNEEAARFAGIRTHRLKIVTYVISAGMAGLAGILYALDTNTVQPASAGNAYELYGIAAAVLGGCSLRGGEGTVAGIIVGACIITVLPNALTLLKVSTFLEFAVIGLVILVVVILEALIGKRL